MGLKICDASDREVDVISPSCDNWVRGDFLVPAILKESQEFVPHGILQRASSDIIA